MAGKSDELTYQQRLDVLHEVKLKQTREKQECDDYSALDEDDHGLILLPPELREAVESVGGSGNMIKDVVMKNFKPKSNHSSGGFFGAKAVGENFGLLLKKHPTYINVMSSLAGGYMVNFLSYLNPNWKPEFDYSHLHEEQKKYGIVTGIAGVQHFCPDLNIGLKLGWGGLMEKVLHYRKMNAPQSSEFYDGLEKVIDGIQNLILRHSQTARKMLETEKRPQLRQNLEIIADICEQLVTEPPQTFRQACQWIGFFIVIVKIYNNSGGLGRLDELLYPYYKQDIKAGVLTNEEAIFHLACLLLIDSQYIQLGGPDTSGKDTTNELSFLILEAIHRLKAPANIGIRVHDGLDPNLLRRGVEILFEDKMGFPKFLGDKGVTEGFVRNDYPIELARQRVYSGCHWFGIPGREYTMMDMVKVNFAAVFEVALREMMADSTTTPGVKELWQRFKKHLERAIEVTAKGIDFHLEHMHEVYPELPLDLFCYGPIEKGQDITHGGVEYYNMCVDGAALATVADSFAAVEQRIEKEGLLTWQELMSYLDNDFADAEKVRLMLKNISRYGSGGSQADMWAVRISRTFTRLVKQKPTPAGFNKIPGLFSWASTIEMGQDVGATPNGRHAHAPISHGASPDPGFSRNGGAITAMAMAVASVQPGYGNTAPLQLDMDASSIRGEEALTKIEALIRGHFASGGTLINMNILNKEQIIEAHKDPSKFPDLMVRVTGFSAYFASLSRDFRQLVVDRILAEG
jgi:formate C-acetyltransferase